MKKFNFFRGYQISETNDVFICNEVSSITQDPSHVNPIVKVNPKSKYDYRFYENIIVYSLGVIASGFVITGVVLTIIQIFS